MRGCCREKGGAAEGVGGDVVLLCVCRCLVLINKWAMVRFDVFILLLTSTWITVSSL